MQRSPAAAGQPGLQTAGAVDGADADRGREHGAYSSTALARDQNNRGVPVATTSVGDSLWFYGETLSTPYTDANVYFLRLGKGPQMRSTNPGKPASPATSFADTVHAEQDVLPMTSLFHDPEADFWLWGYVIAGDATAGTRSFAFTAPDVLAGQSLGVSLLGMSETGKGRHHVTVKLNGTELGEVRLGAHEAVTATFKLPPRALRSGANELQLTGVRDEGVSISLVALDGIDVTYKRAATAASGRLTLTADRAGAVKVGGLGARGAQVYDVSTSAAPVVLTGTLAGGAGASSSVQFAAAAKHLSLIHI